MKKITKLFAALTAAAALLAAGCKSSEDYADDNTPRNAFNVAGLYVTGLSDSFDGSEVKLFVTGVDETGTKGDKEVVATTVAKSESDENGTVLWGYKSGTAWVEIEDTDKLYDGDKMAQWYYAANKADIDSGKTAGFAASSFECYLTVGSTKIQVASSDGGSLENAVLSVPTSEAGTSNSALVSRFVQVIIADGVATFSLVSTPDEPKNITLENIKLDLAPVALDKLTDYDNDTAKDGKHAIDIKTSDKASGQTNSKYTVTIKGLDKGNVGTALILSGSKIAAADSGVASVSDWIFDTTKDNGFIQTISKVGDTPTAAETALGLVKDDVYVSFTFYGATPTHWAQYRDYMDNDGNNQTKSGPEILITTYKDGDTKGAQDVNPRLLESPTGLQGGTQAFNFMFPKATEGKNVSLTIDRTLLKDDFVSQDDPAVSPATIHIDAIKVTNAPTIEGAGYLAYCETWLSKFNDNNWNTTTPYKLNDSGFYTSDNSAYLLVDEDYMPGTTTFSLKIQVLNPKADKDDVFWGNKIVTDSHTTPVLQTADYANKHWILVCERKSMTAEDAYQLWLEPTEDDADYEGMLGYSKADIITDYRVQGWYKDSWKDASVTKITKVTDHEWKWTIEGGTEGKTSYKFSIIPAEGDWSDRYELSEDINWDVGTPAGPLNHNNEPTRAVINIPANATYTFTVKNTNKGVFVTAASN